MNDFPALALSSLLAIPQFVPSPKAKPAAPRPSETVIPRYQRKEFPAPAAGQCGIKSFTLMDYEVRSREKDGTPARLTEMGAAIETTAPDCIRDFGVVQFIRGCVYHAEYSAETGAELSRSFDVARRLRGPRVVFNHPDFEVDQMGRDPMYTAEDGETDRVGFSYIAVPPLRLRSDRASLLEDLKAVDNPSRRTFLMDAEKPAQTIFVADLPEGGVVTPLDDGKRLVANNSSLDFKTCLYRVADVPLSGDPTAAPLVCFTWMSRYTYDAAANEYATDKFGGVDSFCAQAPARVPLPDGTTQGLNGSTDQAK
jgi:hypothetical protein